MTAACIRNNLHPNAKGAEILSKMVSELLFPTAQPVSLAEDPYPDFEKQSTVHYRTETSGEPVSNPHKGFVMTLYNPDMLYAGKHLSGNGR